MFSQSHFLQVNRQQSHQSQIIDFPRKSDPHHPTRRSSPSQTQGTGWQRLTLFWEKVCQKLAQRSQLSIEQRSNGKGESWWQVTDPRSGQSFYAQTLNEAVHWIEVQQLGK